VGVNGRVVEVPQEQAKQYAQQSEVTEKPFTAPHFGQPSSSHSGDSHSA